MISGKEVRGGFQLRFKRGDTTHAVTPFRMSTRVDLGVCWWQMPSDHKPSLVWARAVNGRILIISKRPDHLWQAQVDQG